MLRESSSREWRLSGDSAGSQDIASDGLVNRADRTRLCTWHTAPLALLQRCLRGATPQCGDAALWRLAQDARHLVRWCLKGCASQRPSLPQILAHRFLLGTEAAVPPQPLPMRYTVFIR